MKHTRVQRRRQTKRKGSRKGTRKQQGGQPRGGVGMKCPEICPYGDGYHDFNRPTGGPGQVHYMYCNKCNCRVRVRSQMWVPGH